MYIFLFNLIYTLAVLWGNCDYSATISHMTNDQDINSVVEPGLVPMQPDFRAAFWSLGDK
jgi:hypothetical protein